MTKADNTNIKSALTDEEMSDYWVYQRMKQIEAKVIAKGITIT